MATDDDVIGNEAAAVRVGLKVGTWRPYVKRTQAPQPYRREIRGGHALPVWHGAELDEWRDNRPGRGARTDLARSADGDHGRVSTP